VRSRAHQRFRLAKCLFQRAGLVFVDLQGDRGYRDFQDSFVDVRVFWQLIQPRKPLTRRLETINANPRIRKPYTVNPYCMLSGLRRQFCFACLDIGCDWACVCS
jgi:hypothetical protein